MKVDVIVQNVYSELFKNKLGVNQLVSISFYQNSIIQSPIHFY
ncbi:MAG: hypothetical protein BAJALOKI3v1_150052 [Promethearchaeota archaeon]|nr:MAG: hypothetical protein BAJALOKI3v1_150052 [Candidatus Lokiarchaeota archaeon]